MLVYLRLWENVFFFKMSPTRLSILCHYNTWHIYIICHTYMYDIEVTYGKTDTAWEKWILKREKVKLREVCFHLFFTKYVTKYIKWQYDIYKLYFQQYVIAGLYTLMFSTCKATFFAFVFVGVTYNWTVEVLHNRRLHNFSISMVSSCCSSGFYTTIVTSVQLPNCHKVFR